MAHDNKIDSALDYADKVADDPILTDEQIAERHEFGRSFLSSLNGAMGMFSGEISRSKKSIDEKIAYWKKLAEETANEAD